MAPPRPPPELIDDAVAEILLRLPPDEPAHLVRASLVCKPWRRILSSAAFLRRYRRFHGSPPLLGFFRGYYRFHHTPRFVPTTDASPFRQAVFDRGSYFPLDCRHGRVLLKRPNTESLTVWDPVTGHREEVREPGFLWYSATVLCAVSGCDHRDCHGGPYLLLCMGTDSMAGLTQACVYSSQAGSWGALISAHVGRDCVFPSRGTLVGDEIHIVPALRDEIEILKFNFVEHSLSVIDPPDLYEKGLTLMLTEDGSLGVSAIRGSELCLWSRKANADGVEGWVQYKVIELQTLLPGASLFEQCIVSAGFAEGACVIFMSTGIDAFIVELKTGRARKVAEPGFNYPIIPFMSFYTPDCACSKLPLPAVTN